MMINTILETYRKKRHFIEEIEKRGYEHHENAHDLYNQWIEDIHKMELDYPNIRNKYQYQEGMRKSFSHEQIDFICWQIGDWYLCWEDKNLNSDNPNQDWLGQAKEQLKTMICGD